jgi:hypothetical protein
MSATVGIFEREDDVKDAVRLLREAGMEHTDLRVVLKNAESALLLERESEVPVEELEGLEAAYSADPGWFPFIPVASGTVGNSFSGGGVGPGVYLPGMSLLGLEDKEGSEDALKAIGVSDQAAERCSTAVGEGKILLIAFSDTDSFSEALLRQAGASEVLS